MSSFIALVWIVVQALNECSSDSDSAYVAITPDDAELEDLFEDLAKNISKPGATNIVVKDKILNCFKINSLTAPLKETETLINLLLFNGVLRI